MKNISKIILMLIFLSTNFVFSGEDVSTVKKTKEDFSGKEKMEIGKRMSFAKSKKKQKKYRAALNYIEEIQVLDPDFIIAKKFIIKWKAECYKGLDLADSSISAYEQYHVLKPDHKSTIIALEYAASSNEDYQTAIVYTNKLIALAPDDHALILKVADYYMQMSGDENEIMALDWYNKYLEFDENNELINAKVTELTKRHLDIADLIVKYEEKIAKEPTDLKTTLKLAEIYYKEEKLDKSIELFLKVHNNDATNIKVIKRLLKYYKNKNDLDKAIEFNKKAMSLEVINENYDINLAKLYKLKKKFVTARKYCKSALKKNSKNKAAYKIWGEIYTASVSSCADGIEYQDQLVYTIAYGLFKNLSNKRIANVMKDNGQIPSKSDYFTNKSIKRPSRKCYQWINKDWNEVKYIDTYLKSMK